MDKHNIKRRDFLKGAAAASATIAAGCAAAPSTAHALQREAKEMPKDAVGILYDSTICIGCQSCVAACKRANDMPAAQPEELGGWNEGTWDSPIDLSGKTLNVIKAYKNGTMATKDVEKDGFAFIKRHCLHCVDPSCVSVCPVSAMKKHPETGIVEHNPDACIGCRYCVLSCPFSVPKYEFDDAFGQIQKCQLCTHLQAKGEIPACCDVCPTGASLFGRVDELRVEAEKRLATKVGESYVFQRGQIGGDRPSHEAKVKQYQKDLYGQHILGGTQVNYLSAVPFNNFDLPTDKPDDSYASKSEGIQHTIYKGLAAPAVLLGGLLYAAHKNRKGHEEDDE